MPINQDEIEKVKLRILKARIEHVLVEAGKVQVNLSSSAAREKIVDEIMELLNA